MRFAFQPPPQHRGWENLLEFFERADQLPVFEIGYVADHFNPTAYDGTGRPVDGVGDHLEAWTTTAALLQATTRLRAGPLVTCVAFRNIGVLAKMISTVDVISGGRVEVALGGGWNEPEAQAYGIELGGPKARLDRLEESVTVLHRLLTDEHVDHEGTYWSLRDAQVEPKCVQRPRPPFTVGGRGLRRTMPLAVRHADQWNVPPVPLEQFHQKARALEACCTELGRDRADISLATPIRIIAERGLGDLGRQIEELAAAGADMVVALFSDPSVPPRWIERVAAIAERYA